MLTSPEHTEPGRGPREAPKAIVIGSGFGGLAAAVRLGARGYKVTVLERLEQAGGRARVFKQDGFVFDAGPTIITAPYLFEELWQIAGEKMTDHVDIVPVDPFYRIRFDDGEVFTYNGDPDAMRAEVARFNPDDVEGYERLMERSKGLCAEVFEALGHLPFGRVYDMLRYTPDILKYGGHLSVFDNVKKFIKDPRLQIVFSFHPLLIGGNPFAASGVYLLIPHLERQYGVHYSMGGTGSLVNGLCDLIERQGGTLKYNADVEEIIVDNGTAKGVRLANGETMSADVVVSNADAATTLKEMLPPAPTRRWSPKAVDNAKLSMALFVWYFGTKRKFPDVGHHTIVLGPRYKGLLTDIFHKHTLAPDFSLYLHRPTIADPSLAPDGCEAFYVLSPVPHLKSGIDWREQAEPYRQAIEDRLNETIMPGLTGEIVTSRMLTPLDFQTDYRAMQGSAFSLEPVLTQSAYFRPHNRQNAVKNLYLVGAGTHPGAGVPAVLSSARVLDEVVPDARTFARL